MSGSALPPAVRFGSTAIVLIPRDQDTNGAFSIIDLGKCTLLEGRVWYSRGIGLKSADVFNQLAACL